MYSAKGGTGKTTVAINVAGALNELGEDVLVIDLDPQGNATDGLGEGERYESDATPNLFDVVCGHAPPKSITDLVVEHEEFDLVPSNRDMLEAERDLAIAEYEGEDHLAFLAEALGALEADYDVVLLDPPPFFGSLTDAAMFGARNVLIPVLAESTSERAAKLMTDQRLDLEAERDISIDEVGVVANRVEQTNEADRMAEWLDTAYPDVPVHHIRKRVAFQRAHSDGVSIFRYSRGLDMADRFLEIAESVRDQIGSGVIDD